jgi:hypothetical protein
LRIYFLLGTFTRRLKVGISSNFDFRLDGMRRQNFDDIVVLGLLPGDTDMERQIHEELADYHQWEFFEWNDEVKKVVDRYLFPELAEAPMGPADQADGVVAQES